jgi:hypothetical protein
MKTLTDIIDEIRTINYYLVKSISNNEPQSTIKYKALLDNLIDIYLKQQDGKS